MVGFLDGTGAAAMPHAQLEEQLDTQGRALINQLLQDHLDLRASREQPAPGPVTGADTVTRTRIEAGHHIVVAPYPQLVPAGDALCSASIRASAAAASADCSCAVRMVDSGPGFTIAS